MKKVREEMINLFGIDTIQNLENSPNDMYNSGSHFVKTLCLGEYELRAYYTHDDYLDGTFFDYPFNVDICGDVDYYEVHCLIRIVHNSW